MDFMRTTVPLFGNKDFFKMVQNSQKKIIKRVKSI